MQLVFKSRLLSAVIFFFFVFSFPLSHASMPTNVTLLTRQDFTARNIFSVGDALRGIPGLKLEQDGSRGTRIISKMRGLSSSNNVLVLIDGVPVTNEFNAAVDLTQIPISMVDRIEILRGGAPSVYSAEGIAGTINIVTIRPDQKGLVADVATGVGRNGEKNVIGKISGRSNLGDIVYAPSNEASGGFQENEDFQTTNHFGNFTRSLRGKGYWGAQYFYHDSRVGLSNGTPIPFAEWNGHLEQKSLTPTEQKTEKWQQAKAFVALPLLFNGTSYVTLTQSWRNSKDRLTRSGIAVRDEDSKSTTMDFSWRRESVEWGVRSQQFSWQTFPNDSKRERENSAYLSGRFFTGALTIVPGLRYDHHSLTGSFFAPRMTVLFEPQEAWLFSGSVQRAHRQPSFVELYVSSAAFSNPDLDDEKSWATDFGAAWRPSNYSRLTVTGFAIRKTDLISSDSTKARINQGQERSKGLETEAWLRWGHHESTRNELFVNWTIQDSERSTALNPDFSHSAFSPRHLVNVKWEKHMPRSMIFENVLRYQSDQYELDGKRGQRIPAYYVWNARFALRILAADIYFAVENITRRRYAETSNGFLFPQPDRSYWTGLSIRFLN